MLSNAISVVIICKNSAGTIDQSLHSALALSHDVIVVDSGSTDGTIEKIANTTAKLFRINWTGYGEAKNLGNKKAENDWILSLDSDEYVDEELLTSLRKVDLSDETTVFTFLRLNYLNDKPIHYGEWRNDLVLRLFNKKNAAWDPSPVHENLLINVPGKKVKLQGTLHHFTSADIKSYRSKLKRYAGLMADKYFQNGKQASWIKLYLSPFINFVQNYFFKGGFLDGKEGLQLARAHSWYTFEKYRLLKARWRLNRV